MKTLNGVILLGLSLAASAGLCSNRANADQVFGAIRISNLQELAVSAAGLANQIKPDSVPDAATLTASATAFGVASDREVWGLLLDPALAAQPYALALPILDPETIKANPMLGLQPETSPDRFLLKLPNGQPMHAVFHDTYLFLAPEPSLLDIAISSLANHADPRGLRAGGSQLALSFAPDRIHAAYQPIINLMLMGMRGQFAQAAPAGQSPNPADILAAYANGLSQLSDTTLRLDLLADRIMLQTTATGRAGTPAAKLFDLQPGPVGEALVLPDTDYVLVGTISALPSPAFWEAYHTFSDELIRMLIPAAEPDVYKTMRQSNEDFAAAWNGTATYGFLTQTGGVTGSAILGLSNTEKMLDWVRSFPALQKRFSALNATQGLKTEVTVEDEVTDGDTSLVTINQRHTATEPDMQAGLEMLQKMGLDQMRMTYGVASKRLVVTVGQNSVSEARDLLASNRAPGSATIFPTELSLPANAHAVTALSLPGYVRWIAGATGLFSLPPAGQPSKPGMGITVNLNGGRAEATTTILVSEILNLRDLFEATGSAVETNAVAE